MEETIYWILEQFTQKNQVSTLQKLYYGSSIKNNNNPVVKDILTLSPPPPLIHIASLTAKSASKP